MFDQENALKIYNDLRSGKINIYQVPDDYLEVIKEFLTKEIQLKKNRLNSIKTEINETKYSIKSYEEKIKKYQAWSLVYHFANIQNDNSNIHSILFIR